jgi:hypothetical protein
MSGKNVGVAEKQVPSYIGDIMDILDRNGTSREEIEPKPIDVGILAGFMKERVNDMNHALIEDALVRIRPIYGCMRQDGSYRLAPESELDRAHMAQLLSNVLGTPVLDVVPVSSDSIVFPDWMIAEERKEIFENVIYPSPDDERAMTRRLMTAYGSSVRAVNAGFDWRRLTDAITDSLGDFHYEAPEHIVTPLEETLFYYLNSCILGDTTRTEALAPLVDRLHQAVPIRSIDQDGRRWLVRVA